MEAARDLRCGEVTSLAERERPDDEHEPAADHLVDRRHERVGG